MTEPSADSSRLTTRTHSTYPIYAEKSSQTIFSIPCSPVTNPELCVTAPSNIHQAETQVNSSESIFNKLSYHINEVGERYKKPHTQLTCQKGDLTEGGGDVFDDEIEMKLHTLHQSETFFNDDDIAICPIFDKPRSITPQLGSVNNFEFKMDTSYNESESMQSIKVKMNDVDNTDSESIQTIELKMNDTTTTENAGRCPIKSIILNMKKLFSLVSPCESEPALSLEKKHDSKTSTTVQEGETILKIDKNTIVATLPAKFSGSSAMLKESSELFQSLDSILFENIDESKTAMPEKVPLTAEVKRKQLEHKQSPSISQRDIETGVINAATVKQTKEKSSSEIVQMAKTKKSHAPESIAKAIHGNNSTNGKNNPKSKESDEHPRVLTKKLTQDCSKIEKILSKCCPTNMVKKKVLDDANLHCECKTVESVMQDMCQTIRNCAPGVVEPKQVISFLECVADLGVNYENIESGKDPRISSENLSTNFCDVSPQEKSNLSHTLEQQFFECFGYNESNLQCAHHKCILKDFFDEFSKKLDLLQRNLTSEAPSYTRLVKDKHIANYSKQAEKR